MKKITYGFYQHELGRIVAAESNRGLCWLGFMVSREDGAYKGNGFERMKTFFSEAVFVHDDLRISQTLPASFQAWEADRLEDIQLDLRGTVFQKDVWKALQTIPKGHVVSYGDIAQKIGRPKAQRAVGSAVGENPVSLIVPCHRVVQASGALGNYGWGTALKEKILTLESQDVLHRIQAA